MRFGICTSIENIITVEEMGYSYIEPSVMTIASMDEEEFLSSVRLVQSAGIRCESFNVLFPPHIKLTGVDFDKNTLTEYLRAAFGRIVQLGAELVVLGSGGSRKIPEGQGYHEGRKQLVNAIGIVGELADAYGLTVAVEPLNKGETNIITSVVEGLSIVRELRRENIGITADFYHMRLEKEPMSVLEEAASTLKHLHIANSKGRVYPLLSDEDVYAQFINSARMAGYDGRLSIEAATGDLKKDGSLALSLLKNL